MKSKAKERQEKWKAESAEEGKAGIWVVILQSGQQTEKEQGILWKFLLSSLRSGTSSDSHCCRFPSLHCNYVFGAKGILNLGIRLPLNV